MNRFSASILLVFLMLNFGFAQQRISHEKKTYTNENGRFFINKELPVYIYLANSENAEGVIKIKSEVSAKYTNPLYFSNEGLNTIRTPWLTDPITKEYILPKRDLVFEVYADSKAPSTAITYQTKNFFSKGDTLFIGQSGVVYLNSTDEVSGVDGILFSIDGQVYTAYDKQALLSAEKLYELKYYGFDRVGNDENTKFRKLFPDFTAPKTDKLIAGDRFNDVLSPRASISLSATDAFSGVKGIYYQIDSGEVKSYKTPIMLDFMEEGEHTLNYYATDKVNNTESEQVYKFWLDKTPPIVLDEVEGDKYFVGGKAFSSGRTKLKLSAVDNKSGVREIKYKINNGELVKYEKPFYISSSAGNVTITFYAYDNVSNSTHMVIQSIRSTTSYVDVLGPELAYEYVGSTFKMRDTMYISPRTKIKLKGMDAESGLKNIDYSINTLAKIDYLQPFVVEKQGYTTIDYYGYDNVNNNTGGSFEFSVDATAPELNLSFSIKSFGNKIIENETLPVYPPHVQLWPAAFDAQTGVEQLWVSVNGAEFVPYIAQLKGFVTDKKYIIALKATDKLGNISVKEFSFYCEK